MLTQPLFSQLIGQFDVSHVNSYNQNVHPITIGGDAHNKITFTRRPTETIEVMDLQSCLRRPGLSPWQPRLFFFLALRGDNKVEIRSEREGGSERGETGDCCTQGGG